MIDIRMPRLSDTMEEGAIAVWHKKPGDPVAVGDVLVEIETDKAVMEYEAYDAGVLHDILVPEGGQATIGTVIAHLDDGSPGTTASDPDDAVATPPGEQDGAGGSRPAGGRLLATPLVRRLAREHAIDLDGITGSGPGGRIVRADIDGALARPAPAPAEPVEPGGADVVGRPGTARPVPSDGARASTALPFDPTRQAISRRLGESSSTTPHFSVTAVADVEALSALRADINAHLDASGRPRISVTDLLVRACALALREHPGVNASYSPQGRGATLLHEHVNVVIAVAAPSGLVVPVVTGADRRTTSQVAAESRRLTGLAKEGRLGVADMTGGTFTISNLGMYGVEQFTAIINPPEGAILAVGATQPEPAVVDGAVVVRRRMRYTLCADHRIIDGALAAQFLASLTRLLEHPLDVVV